MHAELRATYRLQLTPEFGFAAASELVEYLDRLGVSHLYLSPVLQARSGSTHGYDVADPSKVSNDLGGEKGILELFRLLEKHGKGVILDIVPNHLATTYENPWWRDVLACGKRSPYAHIFDIYWENNEGGTSEVLLPVLGDHLRDVIDRGEITISRDQDGNQVLTYQEQPFPLNEEGLALVRKGERDVRRILGCQHYRLAHWQLASEEINYRRFFNVGDLIGARIEDPAVFDATHTKIFELVGSGPVDGLRIDHPDGLRDPAGYFHDLRHRVPHLWLGVEKILEPGEALPETWPVDGTTGYDFLQVGGGLWVDPRGEKAISDFYVDFTGRAQPYGLVVRTEKQRIIEAAFQGDLMRLVMLLRRICDARLLDYPNGLLKEVVADLLANFPVYRTYVKPSRGEITSADRQAIAEAVAICRRRQEPFDENLLVLLEGLLAPNTPGTGNEREFLARFQQMTGPVMAKGVEDTTFYCYDRLLALNEVGCDPAQFGVPPSAFHEYNVAGAAKWPRRMLASSTHDTKRSEDVRCRLSLLSEIPVAWADEVRRWAKHNHGSWQGREPDRSAEHLFYQTLVGAWPIEQVRVKEYMRKAYREARRFTSWAAPDESYERRMDDFIDAVLDDPGFISMLETFVGPLVLPGRVNSLAQTLLKMTVPGVPDIYQGCEIWDNSLVDPDNRRPVDFKRRAQLLELLENAQDIGEIMDGMEAGLPKLHVIQQALALRVRRPASFGSGEEAAYQPLPAGGRRLTHLIAFKRGSLVAVVVPRLPLGLGDGWEDTTVTLGRGRWTNVFDGERFDEFAGASDLFRHFPVALLERTDTQI